MGDERHLCEVCDSTDASFQCTACGEVWYCSRPHQSQHWNQHSRECKSYRICCSEKYGRYMISTRKLKAENMVLVDIPVVTGPLALSDIVCLTCHIPISEEIFLRCPDCKWPMCSEKCLNSRQHDDECKILSKDEKLCGVPRSIGVTPRYDIIMVLRCLLLRSRNPLAWEDFCTMVSHNDMREQDPLHVATVRYLKEVCEVDYDVETISHVRGVIVSNAFELRTVHGNQVRAMYNLCCRINHSCIPNVNLASAPDGRMEVRAAVNIEKGEELFVSYVARDFPLWQRREMLLKGHYFFCECTRCSDPTELGIFYSSPRCSKCSINIMESHTKNNQISWVCKKCNTWSTQEEIQQDVDDWIFRLDMNELLGTGSPGRIAVALANVERAFHRKHYVYLRACQDALHRLRHNDNWTAIKMKNELWKILLSFYDVLEKGVTRRRGMTMLEAGKSGLVMVKAGLANDEISRAQAQSILRESEDHCLDAKRILQMEPRGSVEYLLALKATKQGDEMFEMIQELD